MFLEPHLTAAGGAFPLPFTLTQRDALSPCSPTPPRGAIRVSDLLATAGRHGCRACASVRRAHVLLSLTHQMRQKSATGRSPCCLSGGVSVPVFTLGAWTRGRQLSGGQRFGSAAGASMTRPPLRRCTPRTRSGSSIRSASRSRATWPVCSRRRNRPSASSARRSSTGTRLKDGGTENLAGVSMLRFRADGLVSEERDFTQG